MTEMEQGSGLDVDTSSSPAPVALSTPQHDAPERVFKQQEVNDIVKREKHAAIESFKRMAVEQPQYLQQKHPDLVPLVGQHQQQSTSNAPVFNQDDIRRMAADEIHRHRTEWEQNAQRQEHERQAVRIAEDFTTRLKAGEEKYENFKQITESVKAHKFGNAVHLATMFDNTADIWYHLAKDPVNLHGLNSLAIEDSDAAYAQIQRLSKNLKDNESAQNTKLPNSPLSQMRPSNAGTNNGALSISDYRRKYKA